MERDLVLDRRPEAAALLGSDVDDRRARERERRTERLEQRPDVVPGDDADVGEPEILEQLTRLGEPDDGGAQPLRQLQEVRAEHRDALDRLVVGALALPPRARQLDLREVLRERPDRRADRHLVVVDDDEHLGLALADVVERLERQAAHQRRVTDDDRDALHAVAQVARLGQPLGDRETGPGVPAVEHVMRRFAPPREAPDAIERAQGPEAGQPTRQQLVRIGLVTGIPDDPVARRLQQPMQRDGQLDDTERGAEMAAGFRDGADDRLADLGRELGQFPLGQAAQVRGALQVGKDGHGGLDSGMAAGRTVWSVTDGRPPAWRLLEG